MEERKEGWEEEGGGGGVGFGQGTVKEEGAEEEEEGGGALLVGISYLGGETENEFPLHWRDANSPPPLLAPQ